MDAFERPVWPRAHTHIKEGERACLDDHHGSSDLKCMVVEFLEKKVKICQYLDSTIYKHAHTHTRTHIYIYIYYYIIYIICYCSIMQCFCQMAFHESAMHACNLNPDRPKAAGFHLEHL